MRQETPQIVPHRRDPKAVDDCEILGIELKTRRKVTFYQEIPFYRQRLRTYLCRNADNDLNGRGLAVRGQGITDFLKPTDTIDILPGIRVPGMSLNVSDQDDVFVAGKEAAHQPTPR